MTPTVPDKTVSEMLDERVAASPEATAFCREASVGAWVPISWHEFKMQAERLAMRLLRQGLRRGDRLALIAPVSLDWELLHHAALRVGIVVVGLDAHDLPPRVAAMCDTADITAVATTSPGLLAALQPERRQRLRCVIMLPGADGPAPAGLDTLPLDRLLQEGGSPGAADTPRVSPGDIATIIFTSGTTGAPKGIGYTQAQLCLAIEAISDAFPFVGPDSRLLCWLPLSNLFQRMVNLAGMRRGAASYLLADPRRVMDVVAGVSPDVFIGVPRFYEKLYQGIQARIQALPMWQRRLTQLAWDTGRRAAVCRLERKPTPRTLGLTHRLLDQVVLARVRQTMGGRLRCMVTGSAPTPEYLLREFYALGWLLLESYGLSENVLPMAMNRIDDFEFGTVGRPLAANDIMIGADGVLAVRGPGVFGGYLGADADAAGSGYYSTGDLGSIDSHGYLRLQGRRDDTVKTSTGQKIELPALEAVLRQVDGVCDAVIVAQGRKYPVAICTTELDVSDRQIQQPFERRLIGAILSMPEHKRPRAVLVSRAVFSIASGELTPNLKVRRVEVESAYSRDIEFLYRTAGGATEPMVRIHFGRAPSSDALPISAAASAVHGSASSAFR